MYQWIKLMTWLPPAPAAKLLATLAAVGLVGLFVSRQQQILAEKEAALLCRDRSAAEVAAAKFSEAEVLDARAADHTLLSVLALAVFAGLLFWAEGLDYLFAQGVLQRGTGMATVVASYILGWLGNNHLFDDIYNAWRARRVAKAAQRAAEASTSEAP